MKEKINLFWYKRKGKGNFGDELGPYLVEKLSGLKASYVPILNSPIKIFILYVLGLFKGLYGFNDCKYVFGGMFKKNVLITVGSILNVNRKKTTNIWGAGIISNEDKIVNANFFAVRGKYSQQKLKALGYNVPNAIGDPALLLPLLIKPKKKKYKLGIIPHYLHYDEVYKLIQDENIIIINLLDDVESVVHNITSCEKTISSSLHGLIVSHVYSIESLWVDLSETKLAGDNVKFKDYFSSVNISEYLPFNFSVLDFKEIQKIFDDNTHISLIQNDLKNIQQSLIDVAPFKILEKYKNV